MIKLRIFINVLFFIIFLYVNIKTSEAEITFLTLPDSPYENKDFYLAEKELKNLPKNTNFIIHIGHKTDAQEGDCDENNYKDLSFLLKQSPLPVFIIPGANVYWNCKNKNKRNPFWDKYFGQFENNWDLNFSVARQKEQKENFAFLLENTLFIGINLFEKRDREVIKFNKILRNNISWVQENLTQNQNLVKNLVIFSHDFSGLKDENSDYFACGEIQFNSWNIHKDYKLFRDQFIELAKNFNKPILYIHGNKQCWTYDRPYKELKNIERIILDKLGNQPMVKITVGKGGFAIDQRTHNRFDFYLHEAIQGNPRSQYFLGLEYLKIQDYENSTKWLTKASLQNYPPAQILLGEMLKGNNNENKLKDYAKAIELFQLSIDRKNFNINNVKNKKTDNTPLTYQKRINQFHKEVIKNSLYKANFNLGTMYFLGLGTSQDYKKALNYFKKAGKGVGSAYYNIATIYYNGLGVKKDVNEAKNWCIKGALNGIKECSFLVGNIYRTGQDGVKPNYLEAVKWFKLAGKHGKSLFNLGVLYFKGLGVSQNIKTAIKYFKNAEINGSLEAKKVLESLRSAPK